MDETVPLGLIPHVKEFITDIGFPITLVLIGIWLIVRLGRFFGPLVAGVFAKHMEFVDTLRGAVQSQTAILESNTTILRDVQQQLLMLSPLVTQVADRHVEFLDSLHIPKKEH